MWVSDSFEAVHWRSLSRFAPNASSASEASDGMAVASLTAVVAGRSTEVFRKSTANTGE